MNEKIYLQKLIAKEGGNFGSISISMHVDTLVEFARKHQDSRGYLRLKLCKRRVPGERFGDTHYIELDTWKPDSQERLPLPEKPRRENAQLAIAGKQHKVDDATDDDVPF